MQPDGVQSVRIRGLAMRDAGRLETDTIVPDTVPVHVEYDYSSQIGTAALRRDETGIWADVTAEDGPWRESCRYFGMSFRCGHAAARPGGGLGEAIGVSLVASNGDPDLPPWEVVCDA